MTEVGGITTTFSLPTSGQNVAYRPLEEAVKFYEAPLGSIGRPNLYVEVKVSSN